MKYVAAMKLQIKITVFIVIFIFYFQVVVNKNRPQCVSTRMLNVYLNARDMSKSLILYDF